MKVTKRTQRCRKREETYGQRNTVEQERYDRGHCLSRITENSTTNSSRQSEWTLEQILSSDNLNLAFKKVKKNKGAGGIDKMTTDELLGYLIEHRRELILSIRNGTYQPQPVRRVEIPKDNGKTRKIGIPTVVDRMIQQAIAQVIMPLFERQFSNRSTHDALLACQKNVNDGYHFVVDLDLQGFSDINLERYMTV